MSQEIKELVRMANTDIRGHKTVLIGLSKVYGIGPSLSNALCETLNLDKSTKIGSLDPDQIKEIESAIANLSSKNIPSWAYNRQNDYDSGEDMHITGPKLKLTKEFDIRRMKKIKSYRGVRHMFNLPVRGQRTRGNFRKGSSVGVVKKSSPAKAGGKKK